LFIIIRFQVEEAITNRNQAKSSVIRAIRKEILERYPALENDIDLMFPKKTAIYLIKCREHVNLVVCNSIIWFFNIRDGPYFPTLRTLHRYPDLLPRLKVDKGAIPFIFKGAHIMCRGLTSKGGDCSIDVEANNPVSIYCEGKVHAIAIGMTHLSTKDIRTINEDIGIKNIHYLSDGLWITDKITS